MLNSVITYFAFSCCLSFKSIILKLMQDTYPCNKEIAALTIATGAERYITSLNKLIPATEIKIYIIFNH